MKKYVILSVALVLVTAVFARSGPSQFKSSPPGLIPADSAYALVAGGSKGIGFAIAEALAKRGYNLILIARHMDSLVSSKNELECLYGVHVEIIPYDLSREQAATDIARWCTERNIHLKMLCNVAGFGGSKAVS